MAVFFFSCLSFFKVVSFLLVCLLLSLFSLFVFAFISCCSSLSLMCDLSKCHARALQSHSGYGNNLFVEIYGR